MVLFGRLDTDAKAEPPLRDSSARRRLRAYFLASSTDTLRKSFSSLLNSSAALRARVPAALLFFLYLKIGVLGECGDLLLDLSY